MCGYTFVCEWCHKTGKLNRLRTNCDSLPEDYSTLRRGNMEILQTVRGQTKIVLYGFIYIKLQTLVDGETTVYECEQRRKGLCKARVKVKGDVIVEQQNEHTHAGDHARVEALKVRNALKRTALETRQPASQIIAESISTISEATVSKLPKFSTISRTIRRQRQEAFGVPFRGFGPKIFADCLANLVIPKEFQETLRGDGFLLYDYTYDKSRIIIFGTSESIKQLERSDHWFCDGSFKFLPELNCHLLTVHTLVGSDNVIPCVFGLLPNQDEKIYNDFFRGLLTLNSNLNPRTILTDYELPTINALRLAWPKVTIDGCFYHLSQAIYRKVQSESLTCLFASDSDFPVYIKMIAALAFIPPANVVSAFEDLQEILPPVVEPICNYFEDNYIGTLRGRMGTQYRQTPRYPVSLWNVYNRVDSDLSLNRFIEEWHRGFQVKISTCDIRKFLMVLQKEEDSNHGKLRQVSAGGGMNLPKSKFDCTSKLMKVVSSYDSSSSIVYLRDIAHNITF